MSAIPYFELHIRPMFRLLDHDHMKFRLDLWNYDQVKALAPRIARLLRASPPGQMPPKETGGPWPEGWIQTFELWIEKEFPRLLLTEGQYSARRIGSGQVIFSVSIQLANGAAEAWAERVASAPDTAEYIIHLRSPPSGVQEPARPVQVREVLPAEIVKIVVNDAVGQHNVAVTS
jgi:hypothetical protein